MITKARDQSNQHWRHQAAPRPEEIALPDYLRGMPKLQFKIHAPCANWQEFRETLFERMSFRFGVLANLFLKDDFPEHEAPTAPTSLNSVAGEKYKAEIRHFYDEETKKNHEG